MDSQGGCNFGASDHQWGTFASKIYIIYVCIVQTVHSYQTLHSPHIIYYETQGECNYCLSASLGRRIRRRSNRSDLVNSISVQS